MHETVFERGIGDPLVTPPPHPLFSEFSISIFFKIGKLLTLLPNQIAHSWDMMCVIHGTLF